MLKNFSDNRKKSDLYRCTVFKNTYIHFQQFISSYYYNLGGGSQVV